MNPAQPADQETILLGTWTEPGGALDAVRTFMLMDNVKGVMIQPQIVQTASGTYRGFRVLASIVPYRQGGSVPTTAATGVTK